jgi:hypothetical protein
VTTFQDADAERSLRESGFAVVDVPTEVVDGLDALYRRLRPPELTEFTATIQIERPGFKREVQEGVHEVVRPLVEDVFVGHRLVAGNFVVKQPGPWVVEPHQDFDFCDESRWTAVLGWLPLHDVDASGGCLHVVPGSHRLPTLPRGSGDHRFPFAPVLDHLKREHSVGVPLRRGQCVVYDARTLHWSTGNDGATERVAGAFAAIPIEAELLHHHVNEDDTVTVLAVDDEIYADTPFHGYPVRGDVVRTVALDAMPVYDEVSVDEALRSAGSSPTRTPGGPSGTPPAEPSPRSPVASSPTAPFLRRLRRRSRRSHR